MLEAERLEKREDDDDNGQRKSVVNAAQLHAIYCETQEFMRILLSPSSHVTRDP
jgi:hypothetical protein